MSARYGVIDVASLGEMKAVISSDEEAILARRMGSFKVLWLKRDPPMGAAYDVEGLEFDPAKIVMEVGTSYQVNQEARINQAVKDTTLAFAYGSNLDAIATRYPGGVPRLNKGTALEESDDAYRRRIWLSPNGFATAGAEEAYVFHAMTADPGLRDVTAAVERTRDGPVVIITCLNEGPDPVPSTERLLEVRRVLHLPAIKPLTDVVSVVGPVQIRIAYDFMVWLYPGPDAAVVLEELTRLLDAYIEEQRWLGGDHTSAGWGGPFSMPEVHSVAVLSPTRDVAASKREFVTVTSARIQIAKERKS